MRIHTSAAKDKNGPYGIKWLFLNNNTGMAIKSPKNGATKKTDTANFQPVTPPIMPMSFTSPKPCKEISDLLQQASRSWMQSAYLTGRHQSMKSFSGCFAHHANPDISRLKQEQAEYQQTRSEEHTSELQSQSN